MGGADRRTHRLACLSFDVEPFDIPLEYGHAISVEEQYRVGIDGLVRVLDLLDELGAPATFFITAELALRHPGLVRRVAADGRHEIASHGYTHAGLEPGHLPESRRVLGEISGREVVGFRRARMAPTDGAEIASAGYLYNASENPIWLPGRYNHFLRPRRARTEHTPGGPLVQIPASATPLVRWPLFWLAFKNVPLGVTKLASAWVLAADGGRGEGSLNTYFHPWEFTDIRGFGLPGVVSRVHGERLVAKLGAYIHWLRARAELATYNSLARRVLESAAMEVRA
jgi:peptidoglycan/xylan/chitin deacetylase (PgdA/CDA1 family)